MDEQNRRRWSHVQQGAVRIVMGAVLLALSVGTGFAQKREEKKNKLPIGCGDGQVAKWEDADGDPLTPKGVWVCAEDIDTTTDVTALQTQANENTAAASANATAIGANSAAIGTNSAAIGTNASNITTNASGVFTNASDITTLGTTLGDRVMDLEDANPNPDPPCFDNANRYVECTDVDGFSNGTVTDTVTGLIWLQDANCLGVASYSVANQRAAQLGSDTVDGGTCGLGDNSKPGDWRLPTKAEWDRSIANFSASAFSGVQFFYWSSSTLESSPLSCIDGSACAWAVNLFFGNTEFTSKDFSLTNVWPVRGGQ